MLRNLMAEMKRHDIKDRDLAGALDVTVKTIHNKLTGVRDFSYPEAEAIRDSFFSDMRLEYLFKNTGDSKS